MATTIVTSSNTAAKMRWMETYVSEGLNKKLHGLVPRGIIRGGTLTTSGAGFGITVDIDPAAGDAVYSYVQEDGASKSGFQVTYRHTIPIALDLAPNANSTVYVALLIKYSISADTSVTWRTYSEAELFGGTPVVEAGDVLVVGKVVVPAAGPIPQANITYERRVSGGMHVPVDGWEQVLENGDFALAPTGTKLEDWSTTTDYGQQVPAWEFYTVPGVYAWYVSTDAPQTLPHEMKLVGDGAAPSATVLHKALFPVIPGKRVRCQVSIRSELVPVGGANAFYGVELTFLDATFASLGSVRAGSSAISGTTSYTTHDNEGVVPANTLWVEAKLIVNSDGVTFVAANVLAFDDVKMWVEHAESSLDTARGDERTIHAREIAIAPSASYRGTSLLAYIERTLTERHLSEVVFSGATIQWFRKRLRNPLGIGAWLEEMYGGSLRFFPAADTAGSRDTAKIQIGSYGATGNKDLLIDLQPLAGSSAQPWGRLRVYQAFTTDGSAPGFQVTFNASWNTVTAEWEQDDGTRGSWLWTLSDEWVVKTKAAGSSAWVEGAWDNPSLGLFTLLRSTSAGIGSYIGLMGTTTTMSRIQLGKPHAPLMTDPSKASPGFGIEVNAKTISPAWLTFGTDGIGGFSYSEGLNFQVFTISASTIPLSFVSPMESLGYAVVATANTGGANYNVVAGSKTVNGFTVYVYDADTGVLIDPAATAVEVSLVVMGVLGGM